MKKMASNRSATYLESFADTVGNLCGFATVAGGGVIIGAATGISAATAGVATAAATTAYNQVVQTTSQASAYANSVDATIFVANTGRRVFSCAHPILFSIGHMGGATGVNIAASVLGQTYKVGEKLCSRGEPNISFTESEEDWALVDVKYLGIKR